MLCFCVPISINQKHVIFFLFYLPNTAILKRLVQLASIFLFLLNGAELLAKDVQLSAAFSSSVVTGPVQ
jgi:hypothetical protein